MLWTFALTLEEEEREKKISARTRKCGARECRLSGAVGRRETERGYCHGNPRSAAGGVASPIETEREEGVMRPDASELKE
ncbi:hypothetical protein DPEC_G00338890 [Dallia pectoralis]|uniref:Uncharacterized protein n=1 Tax=Dallia pectoralis TaxID=75939 RepID=A0ACC2F4N0_DALPE|nr:hypothetical protein DPEC_G00338890 [Dallia pectoralis]